MNLDASLLLAAAASAAGAQQYPTGALYVVATPIGNLADITLRALHVLSLVDAVACEDTRVSSSLLRHLGLDKPLIALHEHNERSASAGICARLARGERVAYVSDAGTPAVSDPGAALVKTLQSEGHRCIPVPGASSIVAALSVAGDPLAQGFAFVGFLPPKGSARDEALRAIAVAPSTQVLLEAPHRVTALAEGLASVCPDSKVRSARYRPLYRQFFWIFFLVCIGLGWLGAKPAEGGYVIASRILTAWYFLHILVILPILGLIEKPKPLPNSISESVLKEGVPIGASAPPPPAAGKH
jgi:16S rRNA (cytidine(1402)-2'-O)-methyltransferase